MKNHEIHVQSFRLATLVEVGVVIPPSLQKVDVPTQNFQIFHVSEI